MLLACNRLSIFPTATPLPLPTELATTPIPEGSQLGGLEATFVSVESAAGVKNTQCYALFRFYQDGLVLGTSQRCLDVPTGELRWSDLSAWFTRDKADSLIMRGDYFIRDHSLLIRAVYHHPIQHTTSLRTYYGAFCDNEMVLVQDIHPAPLGGMPIQDYIRLDPAPTTEVTALHQTGSTSLDLTPLPCHVTSFKFLHRTDITLVSSLAQYQIQTDPGVSCTLRYVTPDGRDSSDKGLGTIIADSQGICNWQWDVGDAAGDGIATVTIDEITQDFTIEIK